MIIVGDSLNRNQWESLACLLYTALLPSQTYVNVRSGVYKVLRAKVIGLNVVFQNTHFPFIFLTSYF